MERRIAAPGASPCLSTCRAREKGRCWQGGCCDRDMSTTPITGTNGSAADAASGTPFDAPSERDEMPDVLHLYRTGALDEAEARCRSILERDPDRGAAWDRLARIAEQRGHLAAAEEHYRRALATLADPAEAHNNLAVLL